MRNTPHKDGQVDWVKQSFGKQTKPKGWLTVKDVVEQSGNHFVTVKIKLKAMVDSGQLESMWCFDKGIRCLCYRQKSKK